LLDRCDNQCRGILGAGQTTESVAAIVAPGRRENTVDGKWHRYAIAPALWSVQSWISQFRCESMTALGGVK
jgi:hypothetical protein